MLSLNKQEFINTFINSNDCSDKIIAKAFFDVIDINKFFEIYDYLLTYNHHLVDVRFSYFKITIKPLIDNDKISALAYENRIAIQVFLCDDFMIVETMNIFLLEDMSQNKLAEEFFTMIGNLTVRRIFVEFMKFKGD